MRVANQTLSERKQNIISVAHAKRVNEPDWISQGYIYIAILVNKSHFRNKELNFNHCFEFSAQKHKN